MLCLLSRNNTGSSSIDKHSSPGGVLTERYRRHRVGADWSHDHSCGRSLVTWFDRSGFLPLRFVSDKERDNHVTRHKMIVPIMPQACKAKVPLSHNVGENFMTTLTWIYRPTGSRFVADLVRNCYGDMRKRPGELHIYDDLS